MSEHDEIHEGDAEYGLVIPFVSVASKGGPYDDDSFVGGYEMGQLDAHLSAKPFIHEVAIMRTANSVQADLIAMHHGYVSEIATMDGYPEYSVGTFTRTTPAPTTPTETGDTK